MIQPIAAAIRRARADESNAIGELHVAAWIESYRGLVPDAMLANLSAGKRGETWQGIMSEPDGPESTRVYVAPAGIGIAGFSACGPQRTEHLRLAGYSGEISAIYIRRSFQGCGLGRALFEAAASGLRAVNAGAFGLWVLRDNVQARGFYEHLGGHLIGERKDKRPDCILHEVAYGWN